MSRIRWGIVGLGRIARQFAQDCRQVSNADLVAVASRDAEVAARFADEYGIARAHSGYRTLFEDPEVDAVYLATPHALHYAHAADAMRAGKAVLCEKPITTMPADLRSLCAVAEQAGAYLMEGMWTYFLPAIAQVGAWVEAGRIGPVLHVKADFGYPLLPYDPARREYDAALGGGAVLEMGIYPIALALLFLGQNPSRMHVAGRKAANGVEDDVAMVFEYPDAMATLATSFRCKLQNWAYIIGEDGYIAVPDFWRASECHLYRLDELVDSYFDDRRTFGFDYEIDAVGRDLLEGRLQSEVVPWSVSIRLQELMQRVRELC